MSEGAVVGIDLGTTYSVCAIVENGRPRVISDTGGSFTIPSIVAIDDKGNRLVGQAAKRQSETNPVNTVYGAKRLVGRDINSPVVDDIQEHFKYRIEEGEHSNILVKLRQENFDLEEIQAMILDHIRNTAQDMLGQEITKAVVTVPAYYNDRQRQAVREAGKIAQLEVLRIVNEPTAAALAYGYDKGLNQRAAVFDFGGGTFDVSILDLRDNVFEVKGTGGNTFLGGMDFDNALVEHVAADFKEKHNIDVSKDPISHQRIKDSCEQAKIDLSTRSETRIHIPYIAMGDQGPLNVDITIKRDLFEEKIKPLVEQTLEITDKVIKETGITKEDIDTVLLVGGSTRIPLVARLVEEFFEKQPSKNVHPDEAVALGAAILADSLINRDSDIQLLDVIPINISIALPNGNTLPVFERNTPVPNQKMKVFTTSKDNQDSLKIKVVQGDSEKVDQCELIGDFVFRGIHAAPKGQAKVEVIFKINNEGILAVTGRDPDTGAEQSGVLKVSSGLDKGRHHELIQPKKPVPKKEVKKVITTSVTREKKLKAGIATPAPAQATPAPVNPTPPPPKPKPREPVEEGLFSRIKKWLSRL